MNKKDYEEEIKKLRSELADHEEEIKKLRSELAAMTAHRDAYKKNWEIEGTEHRLLYSKYLSLLTQNELLTNRCLASGVMDKTIPDDATGLFL